MPFHLLDARADMRGRLTVDALIHKAPVIDAFLESLTFENSIGVVGPCLPPFL